MGLPPMNVESRGDVSDDENQAGIVTSRARLRTAELLQKPFDVGSIALTGLFILALFYTIYFMRSVLLPIVLALLLSYLLRPIVRGLARLKIPLPVGSALILIGLLAVVIAHDIESQVSRYLFTITAINACLGLAVGTAVGLFGLRNPVMWGVMVALLNFVPYLGALTGIICMTIGATLSFDSLGYALIFPAVYLAFGILEGSFITPWVMGRSLTLNPVIILLSLTFWGWMWGIVGIILAVPILAAFKIFCAHIKPMEPLAEFLS